MTMSEADLQTLYRQATAASSRRDCPSAETLARAAAGELMQVEREQIADHLGGCADCADEFRLASAVKPWADSASRPARVTRSRWVAAALPAAAVVLISVSVSVWTYRELQRERENAEQASAAAAKATADASALRRTVDTLSQPQVDMVVADLYPADPARGASSTASGEQTLSIPADARIFTVILNTTDATEAPDYALQVTNSAGSTVWSSRGLHKNRYGTFTVALPQSLLPAGRYRFVLSAVRPDGSRPIQEYQVTIQYR
jgi:hypothetical protein